MVYGGGGVIVGDFELWSLWKFVSSCAGCFVFLDCFASFFQDLMGCCGVVERFLLGCCGVVVGLL